MSDMKNLTVIIDRVEGSNIPAAREGIAEVLAVLEPLRDCGLRVRVARSPQTLTEDKAWRE